MYNPYEKGRWYRFFIESNGTTPVITMGDIEDATITTTILKIPERFKVKEVIYDIEAKGTGVTLGIKTASTGYTVVLPHVASYTDGYIYIFAEEIN